MLALKGTFLGITIFAVGATAFLLLSLRNMSGGKQMSIDLRMMSSTTIYNPWFWAAFAASIIIGLAIATTWPGKFSPAFWITLGIIDLVPAGILSVILLLVFKLKQVAATVAK